MPRTQIRGENPEGWGEGNVARGLVPRLGHDSSLLHMYRPAIPPKSNRPGWGPGKPSPCRPIRYTGALNSSFPRRRESTHPGFAHAQHSRNRNPRPQRTTGPGPLVSTAIV